MPQVLRPESIGTITRTGNTTLTIGPSVANIGGQQRSTTSNITVVTSVAGANGIDTGAIAPNQFYYIYLANNNGTVVGVISLSSSAPTGFSAYRLVGQCTTDGSSNLVAANQTITDNAPVGHVVSAMLSESQFRAVHGSGWILADGRSVAGSKYATISGNVTAPDLRGVTLRGKNNGRVDGNQNPDGDVALGTFQSHNMSGHDHGGGSHSHVIPWGAGTFGGTSGASVWRNDTAPSHSVNSSGTVIGVVGGNETRMRNVTVNHFIKIN